MKAPRNESISGERSRGVSEKSRDVRLSNIRAAKAVAEAIRTSLGPRGMDKMICDANGDVLITNDGATILEKIKVNHPAGKMLVQMSKSQDIVAGDGTTSVVAICGSMLEACMDLLDMGIHPTIISEAFGVGLERALKIVEEMRIIVDLANRVSLAQIAATSLNSKVVGEYSSALAPIAVDAVFKVAAQRGSKEGAWVDLKDIRVEKKLGGTLEDTELIEGVVLNQNVEGVVEKVANAKIALIQFCMSPPKTDIENSVVVKDYNAIDRIVREERLYIRKLVKKVKSIGCNCLLIQKSILRDATNDLSLHYLNTEKIMVVTDIERDEVAFLSKALNLTPITDATNFTPDKLGKAELVSKTEDFITITGIQRREKSSSASINPPVPSAARMEQESQTASIIVRGSNKLVLDEAERSLHDALCVVRSLVREQFLLPGGGAVETEISMRLSREAKAVQGLQSYCLGAYARALEVIPYTLAENAGLDPMTVVTELRKRHLGGEMNVGVVVRRAGVGNVREEQVEMPSLVMSSALELATECVRMILKIDDIVLTR
eukprot:Plantae.Rhodophyta-Hildenbrandia_rubra.ctg31954.p1 GENE.Plantae.Rhodophyta-Hildenbrandia_rubra.ctg31954~~Plantae.Rhodophyta-Hildenbrandia_rubra.ctg31954.p1  ORF type:complete len:549 (+),score=106.07 Plantae.Rhodophyta-Hildenbrandia_rubra.ctg31954:125-1771(+)